MYAIFQIREAVSCSQMFVKIGVLKNFFKFYKENPAWESLFNNVAGLKRSVTLLKRVSSTDWTATMKHGVTGKRNVKRLQHTGNLFSKNLQLIDVC